MAATARSRRSRRSSDDIAHRAERAQALVLMGETSSGRQALEGAALAPGTEDTLNALSDTDLPNREGVITGDNGVHAGGAVEFG